MTKFSTMDVMTAKDVEKQVWSMIEILRDDSVSTEDYYLILLLLTFYQKEIIDERILSDVGPIPENFDVMIHHYDEDNSVNYKEIFRSFGEVMRQMKSDNLRQLMHSLFGIKKEDLKDGFELLFDKILYRLASSQGRFGGEFIQPLQITRLIGELFNLENGSKVYNPFAGLASFALKLDKSNDYFGQEFNRKAWALGALRLMAYDKLDTSRYVCEDSIKNWPDNSEKFDLIVANPPYAWRIGKQYSEIEPEIKTAEQFLLKRGLDSLSDEGKLISILPQGFLFKGMQDQQLRQFLVDQDLLDTIISLPGGLLPYTSIPVIIMVIDKQKKNPGKFRFINAEKYVQSPNVKEKVINEEALSNLLDGSIEDKESMKIVDKKAIQEQKYNLNVPRYFEKEIEVEENEELFKLKDILTPLRGKRKDLPAKGKVLGIKDLKNDFVDCKLDLSTITESKISNTEYQINESCLLLATVGRSLKPTFFEYEDTPIFINRGVLCFKVKDHLVDHRYLINQLHAKYVQDQLKTKRLVSILSIIRQQDILELKIKLPTLNEQKAKFQGIYEISKEIKRLQDKIQTNLVNDDEVRYETKSYLKHRLGTPLLNIGSSLRNIERALSQNYENWENEKLNDKYDITLKDCFKSINQNLDLVHAILKEADKEIDFSDKNLVEINFLEFIRGYVNRVKSAEKSNINTKIDIHPDIGKELNNQLMILANTELLEIALNSIVENAKRHAFVNSNENYKLEFRIGLHSDAGITANSHDMANGANSFIKVEIANNGKPFPINYSLKKLIRKDSKTGEKGNTGQGGYDLNEIIKFHNNGNSTLNLIHEEPPAEFVTTYLFLIPLNR